MFGLKHQHLPIPSRGITNNFNHDSYDQQFRTAPYLRNLRQLNVHDEEYHRISYLLRASLGSLTVRIVSIHAINTPQHDAAFESNHIGTTVLDSWVNGTDLPEQNNVHNIISHGGRFRITDSDKGAIFTVGNIGMDESNVAPGPAQYEFIHARIAVGRSFVIDPAQVGTHGIPAGYDSMAIHKEVQSVDNSQYFHEYIINDESRVYPDFVVNFVFDVTGDRMKATPQCEACGSRSAVYFCMQDNAKLCEVCDKDMHATNAIYARHSRVLLNEMQSCIGMTLCKEHTTMAVQFFDPVAHIPVCVHCKMSGSHSTGEYATHPLVPIQEAYMSSMEDLERERLIVDERRKTIYSQLASIEKRMEQVNLNHDRCQDQIYEIVQKVVQVLHEETQSKLSALLADESELRRQLEYYAWTETFLNYQQGSSNPVEFLSAFKAHSSILAQAPSEIVNGAATVRADIRVVGRLDVVIDDTAGVAAANGVNVSQQPPTGYMMRSSPNTSMTLPPPQQQQVQTQSRPRVTIKLPHELSQLQRGGPPPPGPPPTGQSRYNYSR